MNRELELLLLISENEQISQRQLSKALNISLGTVNGLIAQMIQYGYITVEHISAKQSKYHLTSLGLKEKTRRQYAHVCESYRTITKAKAHIKRLVEHELHSGIHTFYILGADDEILKLTKMGLIELKREHILDYQYITDISSIEPTEGSCILYWDEALYGTCPFKGIMIV